MVRRAGFSIVQVVLMSVLALVALLMPRIALSEKKRPPSAAEAPAPESTPETPAAEAPPPPDAPMRAHYDYARAMFAKQDYIAAAQTLERAYAKEPRPILLFNIGQAYRKAARYTEARDAYKRFLDVAPKDPMAVDARDHLRTIDILNTQEDKRKEIELAMEQTKEEMERMRKVPVYKRAWFWVTIVGATAAVVAIGVGAKVYESQRQTDTGLLMLQF